ncbi:Serine protease nudel, partial [Araneus ventricosus]
PNTYQVTQASAPNAFRHRCRPSVLLALIVLLLLCLPFVLLASLLFFTFRSQPDSLNNSKAEPVWLGGTNGTNAIFPFEKDLWMNSSSIGACPKGYFACEFLKMLLNDKRLSPNGGFNETHEPDPVSTSNVETRRNGFLLRNKNGIWYPMCANPYDNMQNQLASFACVSITANPLASSTHQFRRFGFLPQRGSESYIYHYQGKFVQWRGCLTASGIYIACNDAKCGLNPHHLLPKRPMARIVGGENSQPGNWPWHAAVYKNGTYACGATVINNHWLLSAAHCFLDHRHTYYEATLGMLRRRSFTPHQKTYRIDKVVPHPKFNIVTLEYDIAMLRTAEEVGFDFWVRAICLPNPMWVETSGSFCTAIGWGDTGETKGDSDDLQEVHVPLTKACKRNHDRWLCAGFKEGGRDACQGDSGGPLMCLFGDGLSWYIAGIISGGNGCARPHTPGMYTRVVYFLDWINQIMRFRNSDDVPPLSLCPGLRCATLGGGNCLDQKRVCDNHVDCYDALDEVNCTRAKP